MLEYQLTFYFNRNLTIKSFNDSIIEKHAYMHTQKHQDSV